MKNTVIAAVSTPPGKGGVAIIRISGDGALDTALRVFNPKSKKCAAQITPRMQYFGTLVYQGEEIDDGLLCYFKSPASFTGEDLVEIGCHGGTLVTKTVLEALFAAGASPARRGEFTERALINGKLSLTDAEAISELLEAKSHAQIRLSTASSRSLLSDRISNIKSSLTDMLSSMLARIDYPDEDLGDFSDEELLKRLEGAKADISRLISSYKTGSAISEGVKTVILGRPNVGKSSVYNLILGEDAAIVTDVEGTTRDVLTRDVAIGKVLLSLSDTAGIRNSRDEVEKIGIERSLGRLRDADLILAVFDGSEQLTEQDLEICKLISESEAPKIAVLNKSDKGTACLISELSKKFDTLVTLSAKHQPDEGRIALAKAIDALFIDDRLEIGSDAIVSNARQNAALVRALEHISSAISSLGDGLFQDAAASDIERALGAISELDGGSVTDEVLSDIFSKFCVGK